MKRNWMTEDNSSLWEVAHGAERDLCRAIDSCIATACLMEGQRGVVGAAFARAKGRMTPDELRAIGKLSGEWFGRHRS